MMYELNFSNPCRVHFIGIGGISMSGLAEILKDRGFTVSGSDSSKSKLTVSLEEKGIQIFYGQRASNISDSLDLVVYTAAIRADDEELLAAGEKQIPCISRANLLGQIMRNYELPIAVAGTHGKTTTTSMIAELMLEAKLDPTLSIGGMLQSIGGNLRIGQSPYFVTEACEYTNSFLRFSPKIALILNVEADHMDFFKNLDEIRNSFHRFAQLLPEDGTLIINGEIEGIDTITKGLACNVVTYGRDPSFDYSPTTISYDDFARASFTIVRKIGDSLPITLGAAGEHNVYNALACAALADLLALSTDTLSKALLSFCGTDRRFQHKGTVGGVGIIDDYAHHPTEIIFSLQTARKYPHKSLWCVFQPHTYTRTKAFLSDFAKALSLADHVVLTDIFAAREAFTSDISSKDILRELEKLGVDSHYFPTFDEVEQFLLENCSQGDLLITMGAGDVVKIGENLLGF